LLPLQMVWEGKFTSPARSMTNGLSIQSLSLSGTSHMLIECSMTWKCILKIHKYTTVS
jgi:hypothetical protein